MIGWAIGTIVAVGVAMLMCAGGREPDEEEHSVGWHNLHGSHQVIYPDGNVSQPFTLKVARDYQKMFGGEVVTARRRVA
jgi:hypothetical protein